MEPEQPAKRLHSRPTRGICYQCFKGNHAKCYGRGKFHECVCACKPQVQPESVTMPIGPGATIR